MLPRFKKSLSLILVSLAVSEAYATQVVERADQAHVQVPISARETNRLAIEGRRIASVVPSVKGALSGQKDEALGAFYFTLANDSHSHGTVTLFVSDEKGVTYKLLLVPRPIAGEEIIIRPPEEKERQAPVARTDETRPVLSAPDQGSDADHGRREPGEQHPARGGQQGGSSLEGGAFGPAVEVPGGGAGWREVPADQRFPSQHAPG